MSIDQMPDDPFGMEGEGQLVCPRCGGEDFHFVHKARTVMAVCPPCKLPCGEWPKPLDTEAEAMP